MKEGLNKKIQIATASVGPEDLSLFVDKELVGKTQEVDQSAETKIQLVDSSFLRQSMSPADYTNSEKRRNYNLDGQKSHGKPNTKIKGVDPYSSFKEDPLDQS